MELLGSGDAVGSPEVLAPLLCKSSRMSSTVQTIVEMLTSVREC